MNREEFIKKEIDTFNASKRRRNMIAGERYFQYMHDILKYKRTVVGEDGTAIELENVPNNKLIDNQYRKAVVQKTNYLCGKPLTISTENDAYYSLLVDIFNKFFQRTFKNICKDSLNCGIGWLLVYYDEAGEFKFKRLKPYEIIPGWADREHTELDYVIRVYEVELVEDNEKTVINKIEYYTKQGVWYYERDNETKDLKPCKPFFTNHFEVIDGKGEKSVFNWAKIPLIAFKYDDDELPLINNVKCLQDALNLILSIFQNNMEEDIRDTIFVLLNYDGENMETFRRNLSQFGAIPLTSTDGVPGDVRTLKLEVNAENYKTLIDVLRKTIIENAMSYDAKDERFGNAPNQMNIKSMYNDVDIDANTMETEYQASLEQLLWFVDNHLANTNQGDFSLEEVEFTFNRSMLINETEIIDNVIKSTNVISDETALSKHPWVSDAKEEIEKMKEDEEFGFNAEGGVVNEDEEKKQQVLAR